MVHAVATAAVASISSTTFAAPATAVSYAKQPTHAITTGAGAAAATLALALAVSSAACTGTSLAATATATAATAAALGRTGSQSGARERRYPPRGCCLAGRSVEGVRRSRTPLRRHRQSTRGPAAGRLRRGRRREGCGGGEGGEGG